MPSNRSLVAVQQSSGEFSEMRIVSSTILVMQVVFHTMAARKGGFFALKNSNVSKC
jgi:hypothetical protein